MRRGYQAAVMGVLAAALGSRSSVAQAPAAMAVTAQQGAGAGQGQPGDRRGQYAGMGRVMGEVTAVAGNTLTVKSEDGNTLQVVTTDNTRLMKDRGPIRMSDMHVGDGLMAMGNLDAPNKTLHAAVVMAEDAAQVKAMRENLGKTYITGRVTSVNLDDAKMTVERADRVAQTIAFDETTSFKRAVRGGRGNGGDGNGGAGGGESGGEAGAGPGRGIGGGGGFGGGMGMAAAMNGGIERAFSTGESITLADIKAGDYVAATGSVKGGAFVPVHLVDSPPGQRRARSGTAPGGTPMAAPGTGPGANAGPGER